MSLVQDTSESGVSVESSSTRSSTCLPEDFTEDLGFEEFHPKDHPPLTTESHRSGDLKKCCENLKIQSMMCGRHDQQIRFYCNDCRINGCFACILANHDSCNIELFRTVALKLSETALENDLEEFSAIKANLENIKKSFDSNVNNIKNNIDVMANYIIEEIQRQRHELKRKLWFLQAERHKSWIFQIELCQLSLNTLKSYKKRLRKLDLMDINFLRRNILGNFRTNLDFIDAGEIDIEYTELPEYHFGAIKIPGCPAKSTVKIPDKSFSNMYNTSTILIRNVFEETVDGNYSITAALQDPDFNSVYLTIQNEKNGKFKISYYPTRAGKHLLHVYLNSIPIGKSPYPVNVRREESELIPRYCFVIEEVGEGKLSKPWGICADYRGRLLVVDRGNDCVKIFTEDGRFVKRFGKTGTGPGEFRRPTGIAVDHVLERIVVVDKDNHRIQVFNLNGIFLLEFGSRGAESGQFIYPWDVSVSEGSLIAVSDSSNRRIQLFDQRGGFIRQFSFKVEGIPEIDLPRGLAFRRDGSLMVTDFNQHRIVLLDDGFESAKIFGSEGTHLAQFHRPQSIDIDRIGRFAVSDCRNDRIQVFKSTGELFCAFGSTEENPHELDAPQGLCFLSNGRIAVVELNHGRIKIFEIPQES